MAESSDFNDRFAKECPRRILGVLHTCGKYVHGYSTYCQHAILCLTAGTDMPEGWYPTPTQAAFDAQRLIPSELDSED